MELTTRQLIRPFWLAGAFLMMMDGLTTYFALDSIEGAREGNPIMLAIMALLGVIGTCALKVVIGILCVYRLTVVTERGHNWKWLYRLRLFWWRGPVPIKTVQLHSAYCLAFSVLLMGAVVGNNLNVLLGPK